MNHVDIVERIHKDMLIQHIHSLGMYAITAIIPNTEKI